VRNHAHGKLLTTPPALKVGKSTGTLSLYVAYKEMPPDSHPPMYGTGTMSNSHGSEAIRVDSGEGLPTKRGTRFKVVLTP
jgi:hypothetical protein